MKQVVLLSCFAALALAQQSDSARNVGAYEVTASHIDSGVSHFSGSVVFETDTIVLHADAADFTRATQEIQARGNVSVKLK